MIRPRSTACTPITRSLAAAFMGLALSACGGSDPAPDAATRLSTIRSPLTEGRGENGWPVFERAFNKYHDRLNREPRPRADSPVGAARADVSVLHVAASLSDPRTTNAQGFMRDLEAAGVFDELERFRHASYAVLEAPASGDLLDYLEDLESVPSKARQMSRIVRAQLRLLAEAGRPEEAAQAFGQGVALARSMRAHAYPICLLTALAIEDSLREELNLLIREGRFTDSALAQMVRDLDTLASADLTAANLEARFLFAEVEYARQWPGSPHTQASVRKALRGIREGPAPEPEFGMAWMGAARQITERKSPPTPREYAAYEHRMWGAQRAFEIGHTVEHNLLRITIAIERHRIASGRFPARLEDLVPRFLSEIPTNPLTGKPPAYRPLGAGPGAAPLLPGPSRPGEFVLYDLGIDGVESGGPTGAAPEPKDWWNGASRALPSKRRGLD